MTTISTTSGRLTVTERDGLVYARGIPYAVADRYQDPVPVDTADMHRDATSRGPACVQDPSRLDGVTGPVVDELEQSEHCQVLTVTATSAATDLPVMVWFHGGAYVTGGGEAAKYDPDPLVRNGVVVVAVTSRLGVFGYLDPTGNGRTNLGLKDQLEALRWVAANIGAFGGDPANVTLFGQSAGADSVLCMIASAAGRRLFHRAIVQSAPTGLMHRAEQRDIAQSALATHLGANVFSAPTAELMAGEKAVQSALARAKYSTAARLPYHPVAGEEPLPVDLPAALRDAASRVELLIGNTKDDAAPFVAMDPRVARLRKFDFVGRALISRVVARATHTMFGIDDVVKLWCQGHGRVATYRFDWVPTGSSLGAGHCLELPFLFGGDWSDAPMLNGQRPPAPLSTEMQHTWTEFAKYGVYGLPTERLVFD